MLGPRAILASHLRLLLSLGDTERTVVDDGDDGADGLAGRSCVRGTHPDDPPPAPPLTTESYLDAEGPKRCLGTAQPAGKRSR